MSIGYSKLRVQSGVTLLEVLIGFVIFTTSLVAVLDYVSNQIYLGHRVDENYRKASLVRELTTISSLRDSALSKVLASHPELSIDFDSVETDTYQSRRVDTALLETRYSIRGAENAFEWTVFELR